LQAAFRVIRLISDLPNLAHVLAYDREQLSETLFPTDHAGNRARDYLAKIINTEFPITTPHEDAAIRLLSEALDPLLQIVGEDTARTFVERLKGHPRAIYIDTLPTPREIRRVTAATASVWPRMSRHLDLFDLFILSIIQYRFPKTYATLHAHPEWFSQMKWSSNAWRLTEEKRWEAERQSFFDNLKADKSRDADFQLVSSLQINIRDQGNH
jgi:predicted KAP-like P-loop ATPase